MPNLLLSNTANALREVLLPYIQNNLPKQTILLDQMKRNSGIQVINSEFHFPIYSSRHGGVVALANDGNSVVSASGRALTKGTVAVKRITGALNISKLAIDATKSNTLAVENILTAQTNTLTDDFSRQLNRMMYSDGFGVVSQVRQTGGSVSGTEAALEAIGNGTGVDDGRVLDVYGTINNDISPVKYLAPDAPVGIGTGAASGVGTVSAVTGTSIQLTAGTAINASDAIYVIDGSAAGAGTSEIVGIRGALSSTTGTNLYASIARNVVGWTPNFGSASEALTLGRLEQSYLSAREYSPMDAQFIVLVNKTLFRKYGDILSAMRRTVDSTDLLGGWTGLELAVGAGRVGVFLDYDVPDGEALVLNLDSWTLCQVGELDWLEDPNGGGLLRLQNTLLYQAVVVWFLNVVCLAPAANGRETRKTS